MPGHSSLLHGLELTEGSRIWNGNGMKKNLKGQAWNDFNVLTFDSRDTVTFESLPTSLVQGTELSLCLLEVSVLFSSCGPGDHTQVIRLEGKHPYPLSHLASPSPPFLSSEGK